MSGVVRGYACDMHARGRWSCFGKVMVFKVLVAAHFVGARRGTQLQPNCGEPALSRVNKLPCSYVEHQTAAFTILASNSTLINSPLIFSPRFRSAQCGSLSTLVTKFTPIRIRNYNGGCSREQHHSHQKKGMWL